MRTWIPYTKSLWMIEDIFKWIIEIVKSYIPSFKLNSKILIHVINHDLTTMMRTSIELMRVIIEVMRASFQYYCVQYFNWWIQLLSAMIQWMRTIIALMHASIQLLRNNWIHDILNFLRLCWFGVPYTHAFKTWNSKQEIAKRIKTNSTGDTVYNLSIIY